MKNIFNAIIQAVSTFFKVHTAIAITVTSVIVVTAVAIPVGIHIANNDSSVQSAPEQITENDKEDVTSEDISPEENVDENIPSKELNEEPVVSVSEKESPSQQPAKDTATSPKNNNITVSAPTTPSAPVHPTSGLSYKQDANPEIGLSWDGQSPIIYTYSDGSTGTEKKDGATYEKAPGIIGTVYAPVEREEYNPYCNDCNKIMGDGSNGTCVRWLMSDVICPNCGQSVTVHTCHTCEN